MANLSSIARPYALAAFEVARDKNQMASWKAFLSSATQIARDEVVSKLLLNPEFSSNNLFELFSGVLNAQEEEKNFLHLLSQNKRLIALPEIAELFNAYAAELEKISNVRVVTALPAEKEFKSRLAQALTKRMKHEVTLHCEIDPAIMGGAIIHIGDKVIDGSIRGKLARLLEFSLR